MKEEEVLKCNKRNMAVEMDKEKFKELISEYKKFKTENVRHFKFHSDASSSVFGKSSLSSFCKNKQQLLKVQISSAYRFRRGTARVHPPAGADLLRHGHLRRGREGQEDQD